MSLQDFEILQELGKGAYGSVYKVKRKADQEVYALKKVIVTKLNDREKENSINEIRILASINHPNVISYKEAFYDSPSCSICTVMEYADDGDLEIKINQKIKSKTHFTENEIWNMLFQITNGIKTLHERKILHRDLKSANVFLFKNGQAKLGDLNVSKINKKGLLYTQTGTPYYASPEVWKNKPYDHKSDIWSLGCVIYEMTTLKPPFRGNSMEQVYNKVIRGNYDQIPSMYSHVLSSMISSLIQVNPNSRPSCEQIINTIHNKKKVNTDKNNETFDSTILLQTIKMPRNLVEINPNLPKSTYKKRIIDDEQRNKSLDSQSIFKIIDTSFIQTNERLNTEINSKSKNSNEKLNHSDISGIRERNRALKSEISLKERSLAEKEKEIKIIEKNIYNIKNLANNNYHYKKSYIDEQQPKCNNINTHNNIIIQNNIQNVIKPLDYFSKCDNSYPTIPTTPIIQDIKYKPLIINDTKSVKSNGVKDLNQIKSVNTTDVKPKLKINRPITASRNHEALLNKNSPSGSMDVKPLVRLNMLPSINKDNSLISNQNLSIIQIKENAIPVNRIYSSNNKRNRDNLFRNDNSFNSPNYSNNYLNNYSHLLGNNESIGNPLNVIPINLVKNRKLIQDNPIKNQELNKIPEKVNKLELINRKSPLIIPKILVNPIKKVSPNNNIAWRI